MRGEHCRGNPEADGDGVGHEQPQDIPRPPPHVFGRADDHPGNAEEDDLSLGIRGGVGRSVRAHGIGCECCRQAAITSRGERGRGGDIQLLEP